MTLRVAMVGAGYFAQFQAQAWRDLGVPVVAIADPNHERAQAFARSFDIPEVFASVDDLLDKTPTTLIDACVPPNAQIRVVKAALTRRVPTICQKPFTTHLGEALELAQLAETTRTPLVIHENFRFSPWYRECREMIEQGMLGRLHSISFRLRTGDGQGESAYVSRQPYFRDMPRLLIRETAVHFIDVFRYLMGDIRAVTARLRKLNPVIAGEDAGIVIFEFDDNRVGIFDGNRLNDHSAEDCRTTLGEMWLEGAKGVVRLDGDGGLWWKPHGEREHILVHPPAKTGPFGGACRALQSHVVDHLQSGTPLENSARDYLEVLRIEAAIYHSHATGARVTLDNFSIPPGGLA
jgi:D-apiose dehydrogenase